MSNLTTNHDLLADALFRANEIIDPTGAISNADYYNQAVIYLNRHYQDICAGATEISPDYNEDWWWLSEVIPGTITLQPAYMTGTVSVTQNSTAATFSAAPATSQVNNFFKLTGDNGDWYRVATHTAGQTAFTLDSVYTDVTSAAAGYKVVQMQYALPANLKQVSGAMRCFQQEETEIVENENMRSDFPLNRMTPGIPRQYNMVGEQTVEFDRYLTDVANTYARVEFDYTPLPVALADDSNTCLIPQQFRRILADMVCASIQFDKNDDRTTPSWQMAKAGLDSMAKEHKKRVQSVGGGTFGKIIPRLGKSSKFDGPIRTASGMILG